MSETDHIDDCRSNPGREDSVRWFVWMLSGAFLFGLLLRLYRLGAQILVDDEWHSLAYVIDRSFGWILTNFAVPSGYTSIPLNTYLWLLLRTVGWSEWFLRMPSVVFGMLLLVVCPVLASGIFGRRRAGLMALLLAISPVLIFYARLVRPYSVVVCLGCIAVLAALRWGEKGRWSDGLLFALCGVLTVYWHPFAAIAIGTVGASVFFRSLFGTFGRAKKEYAGPSLWPVCVVLSCMGIAGALLLLPAFLNSLNESFADVVGQGSIRLSTGLRFVSLLFGAAQPVLLVLCVVFFCAGVISLWRSHLWHTVTLLALFVLQWLALTIMQPHSCHVGIVVMRYSIVLVPFALLFVACGLQSALDAMTNRIQLNAKLHMLLAGAFCGSLFVAGPIPRTYMSVNNFTHHGAFQHAYEHMDWSRSFISEFAPPGFGIRTDIRVDEVSGFYGYLKEAPGKRPVVEYPMLIGDHFNPHYFYQGFHGRPVLVGYSAGLLPKAPLEWGGVYGNTYVDEVLNRVGDSTKLRFRNLINMCDLPRMQEWGVEYVIFHKRFEAEFARITPPLKPFPFILERYRRELPLVHEDAFIVVFGLLQEGSPAVTKDLCPDDT